MLESTGLFFLLKAAQHDILFVDWSVKIHICKCLVLECEKMQKRAMEQ